MIPNQHERFSASPTAAGAWLPPDVWDRWAHFASLRRIEDRLGSLVIQAA